MSIFDSQIVLDVPEAAEALDLSHDQMRWLLRSKALFGRKIGKFWITTRKAVDDYLRSCGDGEKARREYRRRDGNHPN